MEKSEFNIKLTEKLTFKNKARIAFLSATQPELPEVVDLRTDYLNSVKDVLDYCENAASEQNKSNSTDNEPLRFYRLTEINVRERVSEEILQTAFEIVGGQNPDAVLENPHTLALIKFVTEQKLNLKF